MTWLDEDRTLEADRKGGEARLRRINAAIAERTAAFTEAARTNRDGWAAYSTDERLERENAADEAFSALVEEERGEIREAIGKLDQRISDVGAPLVGADTETLTRVAALRQAIRLEVQSSSPDEMEHHSGAALRSGDRLLARAWADELAEYVRQTELAPAVVARLTELARSLRDQTEDPADVTKRRALERRRAALNKHLDEFGAATRESLVEINRRSMQASGRYARL